MDEAGIAKQKHISVLVSSLDAPNQTFLVDCHPLDSGSNINSSIILHTVDDILRQLEIKRENFSLFLTDAARYMPLAGKTLTEILVGHSCRSPTVLKRPDRSKPCHCLQFCQVHR